MGARQDDLRSPAGDLDTHDIGPDAVTLTIALPRHLFFLRQNRIGPAKIDNYVALLKALHDAVDELPFASFEFVIDDFALGIPQALHDVLLGCLSRDPAKQARIELAQQLVADLGVGIKSIPCFPQGNLRGIVLNLVNDSFGFKELNLADLRIKLRLDLSLVAEFLFGRRDHGILQGADENRLVDSLLLADLFNDSI